LIFLNIFLALVFPISVSALPSSGGLYLSISNESIKCVNIVLPDDGGYFGRGAVEYLITMTPDPEDTWSDLGYHRVTTDENNTVVRPVCFSSIGKQLGTCANPFTLRISAPSAGVDKTWDGGACASDHEDVDTTSMAGRGGLGVGAGQPDPLAGLDSADIFAMGFSDSILYVTPEEQAEFSLWVQSFANLTIDLSASAQGGISLSPRSAVVVTGPGNDFHKLNFTVAPVMTDKSGSITIKGIVRDCGSALICTRKSTAEVVVGQTRPELVGFMASVFPENLNVRDLEPLTYRLTVNNMGDTDEFSIDADLPEDLTTTFVPTTITVPFGEYRTITFSVTPGSARSSYELDFSVTSSKDIVKPVTAYLSTNELLTDVQRSMDLIIQNADPDTFDNANDEMSKWYRSYQDSDYGDDLSGYSSLQSTLQDARQPEEPEPLDNQTNGSDLDGNNGTDVFEGDNMVQGIELFGKDIWMLMVALLVILGALFFFFQNRKKQGIRIDEEIDVNEGF